MNKIIRVLSSLALGSTASFASAATFSPGEAVLNNEGVAAHVVSTHGDDVTIQFDGPYGSTLEPFTVSSDEIAHRSGGNGIYQVGDKIVDEMGVGGEVAGVYDDGQLEVIFAGWGLASKMSSAALAATKGQIGNVHVGQAMLDTRGFCAIVLGIFPNQDVEMNWSGGHVPSFRTTLDKFKPTSSCE